jgi:hypothetical protein
MHELTDAKKPRFAGTATSENAHKSVAIIEPND